VNCQQIQPNLLDYATKRLSGPEAGQVKAHLAQCAECSALLRQEVAWSRTLASVPEEQPPHDVWMLVRSRTKPTRVRPRVWLHGLVATGLRKAATAAVAVALVALGYYNVVLVNPEPQASTRQPVVAVYSDDPIAGHTDAVIASIDDM
jgi:anti-sigma factor RsiW